MDKKELLKLVDTLIILPIELVKIVVEYCQPAWPEKFMFQFTGPKGTEHHLTSVVHNHQHLFINCTLKDRIYHYSFDGNFIKSSSSLGSLRAIDIVNNELYLLHYRKFQVVDIANFSVIYTWDLPKESEMLAFGYRLKADQEKIYFTYAFHYHRVYHYHRNGKEIKKYGKQDNSDKPGEFFFSCWNNG